MEVGGKTINRCNIHWSMKGSSWKVCRNVRKCEAKDFSQGRRMTNGLGGDLLGQTLPKYAPVSLGLLPGHTNYIP